MNHQSPLPDPASATPLRNVSFFAPSLSAATEAATSHDASEAQIRHWLKHTLLTGLTPWASFPPCEGGTAKSSSRRQARRAMTIATSPPLTMVAMMVRGFPLTEHHNTRQCQSSHGKGGLVRLLAVSSTRKLHWRRRKSSQTRPAQMSCQSCRCPSPGSMHQEWQRWSPMLVSASPDTPAGTGPAPGQ